MTIFLPLDKSTPLPSTPLFLSQSPNVAAQLNKVIHTIIKAKRIVVVCGAGISVQAGIPDFRSPEGLFRALKRDNPRENLASGKDLFDASVFNAEHTTSLFCQMIAQLSKLSQDAEPTAFHRVLRALDDSGKLLRVYTQNIDAIEQKTGLSFGVPEFEDRRGKNRSKGKAPANQPATKQPPQPFIDNMTLTQCDQMQDHQPLTTSPSLSLSTNPASTSSTPTSNRLPSPPAETPRCIPLHGTLQSVHCQVCTHSFPLLEHLPSLAIGQPPQCPECTSLERTRQLIGKRRRGIGRLRPSVVLYNEEHKDGEGVGEVVRKDLMGSKGRSGADLLLVVGTSLRVPGTKRMVREFSKAVRPRAATASKEDGGTSSSASGPGTSTPSGSTRPSPSNGSSASEDSESSTKAIYLNLDFPVPTREWEGVFDVWLQGDAQLFAQLLHDELEKQAKAKELAIEKKRKRDEEAAATATTNGAAMESLTISHQQQHQQQQQQQQHISPLPGTPKQSKRKTSSDSVTSKRRKVLTLPPSPPKSPPSSHVDPMDDCNNSSMDIDVDDDDDVMPCLSPATGAGLPRSSSSSSPLLIRIPPRYQCYVDVPPLPRPHCSTTSQPKTPYRPAVIRLPPTPEDTPPARFKFPRPTPSTGTHVLPLPSSPKQQYQQLARSTRKQETSINGLTSSIIEIGLSEDEINDYDAWPVSCIRSTQVRSLSCRKG